MKGMNAVVLVKQVPAGEVRIDPSTGRMIRGAESRMNPPDAIAVEAALRFKEATGAHITAISMGPPQASAVVVRAEAMGCDDAMLVCDASLGGSDTIATSHALASAIRSLGGVDLIFCGRQAVDSETGQVGPIVAEMLDIPHISLVSRVEADGGSVICERALPDRVEHVRVSLPALISICEELGDARYATPLGIKRAVAHPPRTVTAAEIGCDPARVGAAGSPSVGRGMFEPQRGHVETRYLDGTPTQIAAKIADELDARGLLKGASR